MANFLNNILLLVVYNKWQLKQIHKALYGNKYYLCAHHKKQLKFQQYLNPLISVFLTRLLIFPLLNGDAKKFALPKQKCPV